MELNFAKIEEAEKAKLLDHMTHDGILKHLGVLLENGVPYDKIMVELKPKDYRNPFVAIMFERAGADPKELLELIGLQNIADHWSLREIATFYDNKIGDALLSLFIDIVDLAKMLKHMRFSNERTVIPSDLLLKHIKRILGKVDNRNEGYRYAIHRFENHVGDFLNAGLDVETALSLSNDWRECNTEAYEALIEHGADPFVIWRKINVSTKLSLFRIWKETFVNVDYKELVEEAGNKFIHYLDELLDAGADANWLASHVTYLSTTQVDKMKSLLEHGADFEILKDKIDPEIFVYEHDYFTERGIKLNLREYFDQKIGTELPTLQNKWADFLRRNAAWLVEHQAIDDEMLLSCLDGIGLKTHFAELLNFYEDRPTMQVALFDNVILQCNAAEINNIVPRILDQKRYEKLLKNQGITEKQLKELLEKYLACTDYDDYLKINMVLGSLDIIEELCPDFDAQKFIDEYPEQYSAALFVNLETVLSSGIKVEWDRLMPMANISDYDLELFKKYDYDINWLLKHMCVRHPIVTKADVKYLTELGADRDLIAFMYYDSHPDATVEDLENIFDGPTIWSKIGI